MGSDEEIEMLAFLLLLEVEVVGEEGVRLVDELEIPHRAPSHHAALHLLLEVVVQFLRFHLLPPPASHSLS